MRRTSSIRCCIWAFVGFAFMSGHQVGNPVGVPVVQAGVVDEGELLPTAAVAAQVGAAFDGQPRPGPESQRNNLGVGMATGGPLLAGAELLQGLGPQLALVR